MIRFNKHVLAATLLIGGASVQAEKDNSCLNIMSWVNGKFRMFSTECPDEVMSKPKKTKSRNEDAYVHQSNGWSFFGWGSGNNITISNGTVINNGVVMNGGCSTTSDSNSTTVSNKSIFNGGADKTIKLTGTKKRVPLNDAVDTVSVPSSLAHVTMSDINPYIECDEAVFGSDFELGVKRGRLQPNLKKNTSIKFKGTGGKPLCTVFAKMLNDTLTAETSSNVTIATPSVRKITTGTSARVAVDKDIVMNKLESIQASTSSSVSVPAVATQTLDTNASTSGSIYVAGKAHTHNAHASTSGTIDAASLKSRTANVSASTSGWMKLWVTKLLGGYASTSGSVRYRGDAQENVKCSTSGSCRKTA